MNTIVCSSRNGEIKRGIPFFPKSAKKGANMKRKFQIKQIIIAVAISILCFSSMAEEALKKSKKDETIKIGVILAVTGEAAISNNHQYEVFKFAIDEVNTKGGVLGKKIEMLLIDNQSTGFGSKKAAQQAVDAGAVAVAGPAWSSHALGAAPILQKAKIPMVVTSATNPDVTLIGDYIFRVCFIDSFQGKVAANFAINDLEAKSAVVLTNAGSRYSTDIAQFFMKYFQELGGNVLWEGDYLASEIDFNRILDKTKRLSPDVIYLPGYNKDSGFIIKQARKMGISVPFLGGDGWGPDIYKFGGDYVSGSYYSESWHVDDPREESKSVINRFESKHGKIKTTPLPYDALMVIVDAINRANSINPQKIQQALAQTKSFAGATGKITFDENGNPINKAAVILKFKNREIEYVKTIIP